MVTIPDIKLFNKETAPPGIAMERHFLAVKHINDPFYIPLCLQANIQIV